MKNSLFTLSKQLAILDSLGKTKLKGRGRIPTLCFPTSFPG